METEGYFICFNVIMDYAQFHIANNIYNLIHVHAQNITYTNIVKKHLPYYSTLQESQICIIHVYVFGAKQVWKKKNLHCVCY